MEVIIFGVYRQHLDVAGKTVAGVRQILEGPVGMPPDAVGYCGNVPTSDDWIIPKGAVIEFRRRPLRAALPDHMAVLAALQAEYDAQPEAIKDRLVAQAKIEEALG